MYGIIADLFASSWIQSIFHFFFGLGAFGLFLLGILDSSFLFLPFGNDLLLIALVSSHRESLIWILYVIASALGSLTGVLLVERVMRKAGESGLEKFVKPNKVKKLKSKLEKNAGWVLFTATLIPPPFPFTAVVMTAAALQISAKKILISVFLGRLTRFMLEALLALYFGKRILAYMNSAVVKYFVYALVIISIIGSIISVRKWMQSRRGPSTMSPKTAT